MELSDVVSQINIVEYISQYVDLEQRGSEWWGLSPFTDEKTPSFSVREDPPFFYCYSSGKGGNVFQFVKEYERCSSREAVEILKRYAGLNGKVVEGRKKMAATIACGKYKRAKKQPKKNTGVILPDDCMKKYEKRDDKLNVWRQEGISDESLEKFQVYYDALSNRLVYPIKNINGDIVNIGGRTLSNNWKERGLRKYTYFYPWGTIDTLYGLSENMNSILEKKFVIIFEGCKSVLIADTWGVHNTAAILTSHLNKNQVKILAGLGCRVVFALDKDANVIGDKNIQKLKRYVNCEYLEDKWDLLGEKDSPVDKGKEVFKKLYGERKRIK